MKHLLILPGGVEVFSGVRDAVCIKNLKLKERVNTGTELTPGSVCAGELTAELISTGALPNLLPGEEVTLYQVDEQDDRYRMGIFILEKPEYHSENLLRLTAYDRLSLLDRDVSAWLSSLTGWPYTLTELAQMLCDLCGIPAVRPDLVMGDFSVERFTAPGITGRQLMGYIAELGGRFVRANAEGKLEFGWYTPADAAIVPKDQRVADLRTYGEDLKLDHRDIVTQDDLQGNLILHTDALADMKNDTDLALVAVDAGQQLAIFRGSLTYENYVTAPVEQVQARLSGGEYGYRYPARDDATECCVLSRNPLLSGDPTGWDSLLAALTRLMQTVSYTPCKVTVPANFHLRPGNTVEITDRSGRTFTCYIMQRIREKQRDTLVCTGSLHRRNESKGTDTQQIIDALSREKLFNKLTNGGEDQGIFLLDGKIYINGDYIRSGTIYADLVSAGVLQSQDGETFYLDLDNGELRGNFTELSIAGTRMRTFDKVSQTEVFNKLTNDGKLPGLFMEDGQLYINANYLAAGVIRSKNGTIEIDLQNGTQPIFNTGISTNGLVIRGDAYGAKAVLTADVTSAENSHGQTVDTMRVQMRSAEGKGFGLINETFDGNGPVGGQLRLFDHKRNRTANLCAWDTYAGLKLESGEETVGAFTVGSDGKSALQCDSLSAQTIMGRRVAWSPNGDGTFTLIGV